MVTAELQSRQEAVDSIVFCKQQWREVNKPYLCFSAWYILCHLDHWSLIYPGTVMCTVLFSSSIAFCVLLVAFVLADWFCSWIFIRYSFLDASKPLVNFMINRKEKYCPQSKLTQSGGNRDARKTSEQAGPSLCISLSYLIVNDCLCMNQELLLQGWEGSWPWCHSCICIALMLKMGILWLCWIINTEWDSTSTL